MQVHPNLYVTEAKIRLPQGPLLFRFASKTPYLTIHYSVITMGAPEEPSSVTKALSLSFESGLFLFWVLDYDDRSKTRQGHTG